MTDRAIKATAFAAGACSVLLVVAVVLGVAVAARGSEKTEESPLYTAVAPHEIADEFGVDVTYFGTSPCGDTDHILGCWDPATPELIYVSATIDDPDLEMWVVLHEIGHVMHHRLGTDGTECAADMFARSVLGDVPAGAEWSCG